LQDEVPGMSNEASARFEQPLLETRQGPALDGDGQNQLAQQIAEGAAQKGIRILSPRRCAV